MRKALACCCVALSFFFAPVTGFEMSPASDSVSSAALAANLTQEPDNERARAFHVLQRLTFGPAPGDIKKVQDIGVEQFIQQQLNPSNLQLEQGLQQSLSEKDALNLTPLELFIKYGRPAVKLAGGAQAAGRGAKPSVEQKKAIQKQVKENYQKLYMESASARFERALYSPRQLQELMADFWFNHFNISFDKGLDHLWVGSFEEQAIRPHVFGRFRDLLGATAHHAGMLFYLDNWQNSVAGNQAAKSKGRFKGLNENYARELMELHTLGVDGGYKQKDVVELARVLTGLGIVNRSAGTLRNLQQNSERSPMGYVFDSKRHDFGPKVLLGHQIRASGEAEIEEALDLLAKHPSTAKHISFKLAQYFVSDNPPPALIDKLSKVYLASDGNIREILNTLFHSSEFFDPQYRNAKFKSPYRYMLSALRASDADVERPALLTRFLKQQGQPLFQCLTPDGYKCTQSAWLNSDALLNRISFASGLGTGRMPGVTAHITSTADLTDMMPILSASTQNTLRDAPARLHPVLLLGSPEFMMY
jgi:uncharacterized protein (DUF1800 family)